MLCLNVHFATKTLPLNSISVVSSLLRQNLSRFAFFVVCFFHLLLDCVFSQFRRIDYSVHAQAACQLIMSYPTTRSKSVITSNLQISNLLIFEVIERISFQKALPFDCIVVFWRGCVIMPKVLFFKTLSSNKSRQFLYSITFKIVTLCFRLWRLQRIECQI